MSGRPLGGSALASHRRKSATLFAKVGDPRLLQMIEFYREDLIALEALGYETTAETTWKKAFGTRSDVCIVWWPATALPVILSRRLRRLPVVVIGAIGLEDRWSSPLRGFLRRAAARAGLSLATSCLVSSSYELRTLPAGSRPKSSVLYLSVDIDFFVPSDISATPMAATVAQLNPGSCERKGVDISIRAAALIAEQVPNFKLFVVGPISPSGKDWLQTLQNEVSFDAVVFTGEVTREEKRDLLARSWFYFQPSRLEGFGLATVEAMATGAVPICSTAGALREVVAAGGVTIQSCDERELAEVTLGLLQKRQTLEQMRTAARARASYFNRDSRICGLREALGRVT